MRSFCALGLSLLFMAIAGTAWAHGYGQGVLGFILVLLILPPLFGICIGFLIGLVIDHPIIGVGFGALAGIVIDLIALFYFWSS